MKNKSLILIIIVVVILLAILIFGKTDKLAIDKEPEIILPEPTADATSTTDSLLKLIENEVDILESQEIDSELINSEISDFDNFGNIYDEEEI